MTQHHPSPLVPGLAVSLASLGVFVVIAWNVTQPSGLTSLDQDLALRCYDAKADLPHVTAFIRVATDLGSRDVVLGLLGVSSVVILWRRPGRWIVPLLWLIILLGGEIINHALKAVFHRPRPLDAAHWQSWSFPSGHANDALVNYGMLAYLLVLALPGRLARTSAVAVLAGVILFVGFSRVYLTVHYFSDVIAGFAVGACWLATWITLIEIVRRRAALSTPAAAPTPTSSSSSAADRSA